MTDTALKYIDRLRRLSVVSRWFILLLDLAVMGIDSDSCTRHGWYNCICI